MPGAAVAHVVDVVQRRRPTLREHCRVVCVDGPAGAGKTTLAAAVAGTAGATGSDVRILHMDDLYDGWRGVLGVGARVGSLLWSLQTTASAGYRRYDWHLGAYAEQHHVPLPDLLVLEGVGCYDPAYADLVTLLVWVEAPREVRLARGLERDGEHLRERWAEFLADEERVHTRTGAHEHADVVVDGLTGEVRTPAPAPREPR